MNGRPRGNRIHRFPADTSSEAARVQRAVFARMSPAERLRHALDLSEAARQLTVAGLRERMSPCTEDELQAALIRTLYGPELAKQMGLE